MWYFPPGIKGGKRKSQGPIEAIAYRMWLHSTSRIYFERFSLNLPNQATTVANSKAGWSSMIPWAIQTWRQVLYALWYLWLSSWVRASECVEYAWWRYGPHCCGVLLNLVVSSIAMAVWKLVSSLRVPSHQKKAKPPFVKSRPLTKCSQSVWLVFNCWLYQQLVSVEVEGRVPLEFNH